MPNNYFQFKEFTVYQDKCGMKVSTDACIQGAWTPVLHNVRTVLDIGTGTGLLSLMVAQKSNDIEVDAVEVEEHCAQQAAMNFKSSKWSNNIKMICEDIRAVELGKKYDLIISNPPFFANSLKSPSTERNLARHNDTMSYVDFLEVCSRHCSDEGYVSLMLPITEFNSFEKLLSGRKWNVVNKLYVHPRVEKHANRVIAILARKGQSLSEENLYIRQADTDQYTDEFIRLMQPYYLHI